MHPIMLDIINGTCLVGSCGVTQKSLCQMWNKAGFLNRHGNSKKSHYVFVVELANKVCEAMLSFMKRLQTLLYILKRILYTPILYIEEERDGKIAFLDVLVTKSSERVLTSVYWKGTHTECTYLSTLTTNPRPSPEY